jgi:hypothetical protein
VGGIGNSKTSARQAVSSAMVERLALKRSVVLLNQSCRERAFLQTRGCVGSGPTLATWPTLLSRLTSLSYPLASAGL